MQNVNNYCNIVICLIEDAPDLQSSFLYEKLQVMKKGKLPN